MSQILESILTFFQGIADLLQNIVLGLLQLVLTIPKALSFIGVALSGLPSVLTVFAVCFITISVVYVVIGR